MITNCPECKGRGEVWAYPDAGAGGSPSWWACFDCSGMGKVDDGESDEDEGYLKHLWNRNGLPSITIEETTRPKIKYECAETSDRALKE